MSYVNLEGAISRPKDSVGKSDDVTTITYFDSNGKSNSKLDQEHAAAAIYTYKQKNTYKVKALKSGGFYNPIKNDLRYGLDKRDRNTNEPMFRWKTITEKSFKNYVKFLKERHDSLILLAEREA